MKEWNLHRTNKGGSFVTDAPEEIAQEMAVAVDLAQSIRQLCVGQPMFIVLHALMMQLGVLVAQSVDPEAEIPTITGAVAGYIRANADLKRMSNAAVAS